MPAVSAWERLRGFADRWLPARGERRLCAVSALPPASTGIAHCTLATYARAPYPVDIFSPQGAPRADVGRVQIFDLDRLSSVRETRAYAAEVFTIGNSDHNLPTYAALCERPRRGPPRFAHLHEPCLIDLVRAYAAATGRGHFDLLRAAYGARMEGHAYEALAGAGVLGPKALFAGVPIAGFLVNSRAARDLLLRDWPSLDPRQVHVLFHPVFPPAPVARTPRETLRLGSFGIPSAYKHTPLLVDAFQLFRERSERPVELWLVGFHATEFAHRHGFADAPGLVIVDAPNDRAFEEAMANVDLAVQLREQNLGESSGAVAQLLAQGTPVIASNLGSFVEFGEAIAKAPESLTAQTLSELIEREIAGGRAARRQAVRAYVESHSADRFCAELMTLISNRRRS